MADQLDRDSGPAAIPSNDHRPNSGLREGEIPHAQVNESIRLADKTIIFGQQNRLRNGLLMEDEQLRRFHAGHDLVKFFYGGIRQIPDYLLDAILAAGISVTLIMNRDLLVFDHVRQHQSFHVGYTRKTIYMPEQVLTTAFAKGYDYWAISEVVIQEAWPLLDYLLILEMIRRAQVRLHEKHSLGYYFVKDTLRFLNGHRKDELEILEKEGRETEADEEDEFMLFYRRYAENFYSWDRNILERDPYEMADEIFDEPQERAWAEWKIDAITHTFNYPTYFQLDRDIVHPAVFELAEIHGLPVEPQTVEEVIHDLRDLARFRVSRQVKTDPLLDRLIDAGAPGILAFVDVAAEERATGQRHITADFFDGYYTVAEFKKKLQAHSDTLPEGAPGSVCNDFNELLGVGLLQAAQTQFQRFRTLRRADQEESRHVLRELIYFLLGIRRPELEEQQKEEMIATPERWGPTQQVDKWLDLANHLLPSGDDPDRKTLLVVILRKLERHPLYHQLFLQQARDLASSPELTWGANARDQVEQLYALVPDQPYRQSSDPQALQNRLSRFKQLRQQRPDDDELLLLLAGILLRLDQADNYPELAETVGKLGDCAAPALRELVDSISHRDTRRRKIRIAALYLLRAGQPQAT